MIKQQAHSTIFKKATFREGILLGLGLGFANIGFLAASGLLYKYGKPLGTNICILLIVLLFLIFTLNMVGILAACVHMGCYRSAKGYNKNDLRKGIFIMGALVTALPTTVNIIMGNKLIVGIISKRSDCINSFDMFVELLLIPLASGAIAIYISSEEPILFKNEQ